MTVTHAEQTEIIRASARRGYLEMVREYVQAGICDPSDLEPADLIALAGWYLKSQTFFEQQDLLSDVCVSAAIQFLLAPAGDEHAMLTFQASFAQLCIGDLRADFERMQEECRPKYRDDVEAMLDHGAELRG